MIIRLARLETDIPAITGLINPYEATPVSADQVRSWFEYNLPERITLRLVTVDETNSVKGYAVVNHEASWLAHKFNIWIVVEPALRRQGVGSKLWEASLDFLREEGADRLGSEVRDDDPPSLAFAEHRGFSIDRHTFHSTLNLAAFDETPYLPVISDFKAQGIRFCTLADFPDTADTRRKLYDLNGANELDIPSTDGMQRTYAEFEQHVFKAPWFKREGQLLAVDGDAWVGLAAVSLYPEAHSAYNLHTGVLRAYRGRKIALALKVLAARYALNHGAQEISTDNDSLNPPILAINRKMGYQPKAGQYMLVGRLNKKTMTFAAAPQTSLF